MGSPSNRPANKAGVPDWLGRGFVLCGEIDRNPGFRLPLSMKQLVEDPWLSEVENLKKGSKVEGTITRITPFGAFVQISPAVEALMHVSELGEGSDVDPEKVFTLNERKEFKVLDIDKEGRKISLSIVDKKSKK